MHGVGVDEEAFLPQVFRRGRLRIFGVDLRPDRRRPGG